MYKIYHLDKCLEGTDVLLQTNQAMDVHTQSEHKTREMMKQTE